MKVRLAHLRTQGINFAVFDCDVRSGLDSDRHNKLAELTATARHSGLRVDKAALAFTKNGRLQYYGTSDLVKYLANRGVPRWTHTITVS